MSTAAKTPAPPANPKAAQPAVEALAKVPATQKTAAPTPAKSPAGKTLAGKMPAGKPPVKKALSKKATPKKATAPVPLSKAFAPAKTAKPAPVQKPKKPKLVRDSFTIPKAEYLVLDELKARAVKLTRPTKKSELLRAGIKALAALSDAAFLTALEQVPAIKTGRPTLGK